MVQESPAVSIPYLVNRYSDKQLQKNANWTIIVYDDVLSSG